MPTGQLHIQLSDLLGAPLKDKVEIDFRPFSGIWEQEARGWKSR